MKEEQEEILREYKKKVKNSNTIIKRINFPFQILMAIAIIPLIINYQFQNLKKLNNTETERRKTRKNREGTFILQTMLWFENKESYLNLEDNYVDIERW
jgi:hypothetical protein